jgi:FkbM family methyltransferase
LKKHFSLKRLLRQIAPTRSRLLFRACKELVDLYEGQNNSDMATNGELRFLRSALPKCGTVFDVGANVGDWAALALGINPKIELHCFEPSDSTFQLLNCRRLPGAVLNNVGMSSSSGTATLYVFSAASGMNSVYRRSGLEEGYGLSPQEEVETIRLDTIDGYCRRVGVKTIDYLKLDVEGHELEVLKGSQEMLASKSVLIIQFEYGGCDIDARVLLKDFFSLFGSYGYFLHKIYPDRIHAVPQYDQRLETFQYQNWIAAVKPLQS